jgi:gluconolactonase
MKHLLACLIAGIAGLGAAQAQNAVERLDPGFDALTGPNLKIEVLHTEDVFFEGPVWHRQGNFLTFSDLISNRIDKWDPATRQVSTYLADIWKGKDNANAITQERNGKKLVQIGSNGQTIDAQGRLVFTAMGSGQILRREADGKLTVLADTYEGRHLNAPNDLVFKSDGAIYFTDIRANTSSTDFSPPEGVPHTGVYRLKDGQLTLLTRDLEAPNGLAFSPDEKFLYVNDIRTKRVMRYELAQDGKLGNGRIFVDMNSDSRVGNPDGMKVDRQGNIWNTGPGGIWIISPEGKRLGTILTPERLSNLAFGDADGKTIYGTGPTTLQRIRVNVEGIRP